MVPVVPAGAGSFDERDDLAGLGRDVRSELTSALDVTTNIEVNPQVTLGKFLSRIRRIRGLSTEQCESVLKLPPGTLRDGESGLGLTDSLVRALARFHGLDANLLEEGQIRPVSGVEGSTVFLLHSGNQDFSGADLGALEEGLAAGRSLCATPGDRRAALATRSSFAPVPVSGPESRDAAQQGYRLANHVRRVLGLGTEPIRDASLLLQDSLGIAVFVPEFPSETIEAASIVDEGRVAACAMISSRVAVSSDPRMRVLLAHELCHVLFDPARPGTVRLSVHNAQRNTALEESRAKGFAAEFLLPRSGLVKILGEPKEERSLEASRVLVQRARKEFLTTSEIAVWHLKNHRFIAWEVAEVLVEESVSAQVVVHTSLPQPGVQTIAPPPKSLDESVETSVVLAKVVAKQAATIRDEAAKRILALAMSTTHELEATDDLLLVLDRHLAASNFELFGLVLDKADCSNLRTNVLGGLLLLSKAARSRLPKQTSAFEGRAFSALKTKLSAHEFERVRVQLA